MRRYTQAITGTTCWVAFGALLIGFLAGQVWVGGPASAETATPGSGDATATREAELQELERLRAQVSGTPVAVVCTPAPTATMTPEPLPTATPTPVPPVASGQPVPYTDEWMVTVMGLGLSPNIGDQVATGIFATVELSVRNEGTDVREFPFTAFTLSDSAGRRYDPAVAPTVGALDASGSGFYFRFQPGIPADAVIVFDVAADAEGPFVLESTTDPTFRVEVSQERSG